MNLPSATAVDKTNDDAIEYTPESVKNTVVAVAHLLDHFATDKHPGLQEPHNQHRRVANSAVLVYPRAGGHRNLVGYQFFVRNPCESIVNEGVSSVVGVIFDMRIYERLGDKYLFNMLKKVQNSIREEQRPSDAKLKELSTQFLLAN